MKKEQLNYLLAGILFLLIVFAACQKTETINIQEPTPCFGIKVMDPYSAYLRMDTVALLDSNFYFNNCSDSATATSFQWNFGDTATSAAQNPIHKYSQRGDYAVTLTVSNQGRASSKIQKNVHVILGQQFISIAGKNLTATAIEETATGDFELLGMVDYTYPYLFQLDSLLKQKTMIALPLNYRLNSMQKTNDGNFIFTGTTQASAQFNELIKMKADGTLLWSKVFNAGDNYTYATQSPDGGYIVVGSRSVSNVPVLVKTDNNGIVQNQWLPTIDKVQRISNAVAEQDGIVFAGTTNTNYIGSDSLLLLKIDYNGNMVWKSKVYWGLNASSGYSNVRVSKLPNGNYTAFSQNTRGIFLFSSTGTFIDRKLSPSTIFDLVSSDDGNLAVLQTEWGNGFRAMVSKVNLDGSVSWSTYPNGQVKLSTGGMMCCSDFWPQGIKRLKTGGVIFIATRVNSGGKYDALLLQLDNYGRPK